VLTDRDFPFQVDWDRQLPNALVTTGLAFVALCAALWGEWAGCVICTTFAVYWVLRLTGEWRRGTRGGIFMTAPSLVVRDWPGRETRVLWNEVQELRIYNWPRNTASRRLAVDVYWADRRSSISAAVDSPQEVLDELLRRAELTRVVPSLICTRYTRPEDELDAP
jgi:hypothetical protein